MQVGDAAYIGSNDSMYKKIIEDHNPFDSIYFYIGQIISNFGITGLFFATFGLFKRTIKSEKYLLIYFIVMFLTLSSWNNHMARYLLSLYPIVIYFICKGILNVNNHIKRKYQTRIKYQYFFFGLVIFEQVKDYFY